MTVNKGAITQLLVVLSEALRQIFYTFNLFRVHNRSHLFEEFLIKVLINLVGLDFNDAIISYCEKGGVVLPGYFLDINLT